MKKIKQILAILGVVLLVGLYLVTLLCAILDRSETMGMFKASVFATVVIPVLIWAYTFIYKLVTKKDKDDDL
jgi:dolichyl-phosphate-mannose--protein O-mannosyl transferase